MDRVLSTGGCGLEILPFAKAIYREGADNHKYIIRTGEQFTSIALLSGEDNISKYEFTQERDIVLTDPKAEGGTGTSMGLAFNTVSDTTLSGVTVSGSISSAAASVGGLAGTVSGDTNVIKSDASCAVTSTGSGRVGGFVGLADGGEYTDCSATGTVKAPGAQGAATADCPSGFGSVTFTVNNSGASDKNSVEIPVVIYRQGEGALYSYYPAGGDEA